MGPSVGGGAGGEGQRIYRFFESLRMALVITLHHKYTQLSGSNHALPIHSGIGVVIMLVLELCLSIILEDTFASLPHASAQTMHMCHMWMQVRRVWHVLRLL